jgi:16S rRNA (adenine1518-N6/adenine1519-N6)-dimethyltransferase
MMPAQDSSAALLRRYGLKAKKGWGQCFLQEPAVVTRILEASGLTGEDTVVEIGAGLGVLTRALLETARHVVAIEKDRDLGHVLRQELGTHPRLEILEENALRFEFCRLDTKVVVVGNLPYNITSPLLFRLLEARHYIRSATVMVQLEVAERLAASPGGKDYGIPSVLSQLAAEVRLCFKVPRTAFFPRPRVDSAVVRLDMRLRPEFEVEETALRAVVRAAFGQRRKTLRRALAQHFQKDHIETALQGTAIDGGRRGETLSLEEFVLLARHLTSPAG